MKEQISYERLLISVAIVLCACIIGYNAFFIPNITEPTIVYVDKEESQCEENDIVNGSEDEEYEPSRALSKSETYSDYININTASAEEIATAGLSGIGEATSSKIVEYRESNGNFNNIEDIMNVSGIGKKTFEKIKDRICV